MFRMNLGRAVALAALVGSASAAHAVDVTVSPTAPWIGYMNVFELDSAGGGFVFGSPWGTADLTASFAGDVLTLGPNSINDPSPFWYTPSGGPGATGNKKMDAVFYVQDDSYVGQTVNFAGQFLTNTFTSAHQSFAFIRDFAPDYSSFTEVRVPATPGAFNLSLATDPTPGRHVQYGFQTLGACVWVTDVAAFGNVTVTAASVAVPGDFDNDGDLDAADIDALFDATPGSVPPANARFDLNGDNTVNPVANTTASDADYWVRTLKLTQYGDTNLDKKVNFDDLLTLAQNYNATNDPSWSVGNFNGDGLVNFDDLLTLAQNYNFGAFVSDDLLAAAGGSAFVNDFALARSMVPEPATLGALAGLTLIGRRRR